MSSVIPHILLVEDDFSIARAMEMTLLSASEPYRVTTAYTPNSARQTILDILDDPEDELDLILLDILMPNNIERQGMDVLRWVRSESRLDSTRVLMLTTLTEEAVIDESLRAGADDYLRKDASDLEQLARIDTALRARAAEKALVVSMQALSRAEKLAAVGELAAGLAHEINNPLAVIITGSELLQEKLADSMNTDADAVELAGMIGNSAERASKTVGSLLDFARPEIFDYKQGDLIASLVNAIDFMDYRFRKAKIEVTTDFPEQVSPIVASWDHLRTVWVNLLFNAQDAVKNNRCDKHIHIAILEVSSRHVQILFQDNGSGISDDKINHIFDPFFTTKAPGQGTGLGLSMTHSIIEKHKGTITAHSLPRIRTSFLIRLPIDESSRSV